MESDISKIRMKVCHLTSVHTPLDPRIFYKECRTLSQAGYDVVLIAPSEKDTDIDGVRIKSVKKPKNRLERLFSTTWKVYKKAKEEDAHIYHFHDPELIPHCLLLKALTKKRVIYDVHEDYVTSIKQKRYLPPIFRSLLAYVFGFTEKLLTSPFEIVLAEKYYKERFPKSITVLNYPLEELFENPSLKNKEEREDKHHLLYTGGITEDRGAFLHAQIVSLLENVEVHMVGRCTPQLAEKLYQTAAEGRERLHIKGIGEYVPFEDIVNFYSKRKWLAGLAIFPPTSHYMKKELTKIFEYMAAGIPIICSNFPVWKSLVEETETGICVDPLNPQSIAEAIHYLIKNPHIAEKMSSNGRLMVKKKFNWRSEGQKLLSLYKEN
jgi:glycosyltransferase involved in cell wall biosynthesis